MAEKIFDDAGFIISTTSTDHDLTDHVRSLELSYSAELQDISAMGVSNRRRIAGLTDWTATVEMNQDFGESTGYDVDGALFSLIGSSSVLLIMRVESTQNRAATNPEFQGLACLESYQPIGNAIGEAATVTATFQAAGVLSRLTSST